MDAGRRDDTSGATKRTFSALSHYSSVFPAHTLLLLRDVCCADYNEVYLCCHWLVVVCHLPPVLAKHVLSDLVAHAGSRQSCVWNGPEGRPGPRRASGHPAYLLHGLYRRWTQDLRGALVYLMTCWRLARWNFSFLA